MPADGSISMGQTGPEEGLELLGFQNASARGGAGSGGKESLTVAEAAARLAPNPGWSGALGVAAQVTYGFRASAPADIPGDAAGFSPFNPAQIAQTEIALSAWSDVANITFVRVGSGTSGAGAFTNGATILFANYSGGTPNSSGFAILPGAPADTSGGAAQGDVWLNITFGSNIAPGSGNDGGRTLLHEIGHAIGLTHPSDYDSLNGGAITYADDAEYYEDSRQYTVMSYFSPTHTGGNFRSVLPSAPMLDDIAAAQRLYGANLTTRLGDTVYGFNATAGREWFAASDSTSQLVFAVWDAGGNDTFDFSGYATNASINLEAGAFSSVGGLSGNIAIALGVTIENVISGAGTDAIIGNNAANRIWGGAGHDNINGFAGQDFLRGEDGDDQLFGGPDFDDLHGNMGNDTVNGGSGDDWVVGGKDNDRLLGDVGMDIVYGNLGNDYCDGGNDADVVRGGQGDDTCLGGAGDDFISGDLGTDILTGGAGSDRFHLFQGSGADRVTDFVAGVDKVQVLPGQSVIPVQAGNDTVIYLGAVGSADHLVLVNVKASGLTPGWFVGA